MKEFIDKEKYTTLEQSKILEPIMSKLGVEADRIERFRDADFNLKTTYHYRLDTLLWVLPERGWIFQDMPIGGTPDPSISYGVNWYLKSIPFSEYMELAKTTNIVSLMSETLTRKGSRAIAAAVELIKLLDENNLLEIQK